jgi:hypothetical protein
MKTDAIVVPSPETDVYEAIKRFVFANLSSKNYSPKGKFFGFNQNMKRVLSKSKKWEHFIVTKEQAEDSKGKLLVGDFVANTVVPINMRNGNDCRVLPAGTLSVHLRTDKITTRHQSSIRLTK